MASYHAKHARVTLLLENVKGMSLLESDDTQVRVHPLKGTAPMKTSSVVEHVVFFNMPYLQGDQEAAILRTLYDIQFKFENVQSLLVGRKLNTGADNVTHALFIRFPTVQILQSYYESDLLSNIVTLMWPHLHGEIVIDYVTTTGYLDTSKKEPICASATLLRRKRDVSSDKMDGALHSLVSTVDDASYVNDITAGFNLFLEGDKFYTHAFTSFVDTVTDLDKLAENSQFTAVLDEGVLPLSSSTLTVSIIAFKPINSAL